MSEYKGSVLDITEISSKQKGTPGLQIDLELTYKKYEGEFQPIDSMRRSVWLYFPTGSEDSRKITLKKLAAIGWKGGPLSENKHMIGSTVDVESYYEEYNGKPQEKFDFPLPRRTAERSENAAMVIDQILASSPVPDVGSSEEEEKPQPKAESSISANDNDNEVPF